ncbi:MAG: hypothetical protein JXR36_15200 [Bacteroidales bacterium]|nr:hypothetical protein [Bacteroidales bacterium]
MKKYLFLYCLLIFVSLIVYGQQYSNNELVMWEQKFSEVSDLYEEISVACFKHSGNPEITTKALDAYTLLLECFDHCNKSIDFSDEYISDARFRYIETWQLFGWFNQLSCTNSIFKDEENKLYLDTVLDFRPTQDSLLLTNMKMPVSENALKESYYNQVYLAYLHYRYISDEKAVKFGVEYIEHLRNDYGVGFIGIVFRDKSLKFHTGRIYNILKTIPPKVDDDLKIEYFTCFLEMYGEYFLIKTEAGDRLELLPIEISDIGLANSYCKKNITNSNENFCELIKRNMIANLKLLNFATFEFYYGLWVDCAEPTTTDLWSLLSIFDQIAVVEKTQTQQIEYKKNIALICDLLYKKLIVKDAGADDYCRLSEYYLSADNKSGAEKAQKMAKKKKNKRSRKK